MKSGQDPLLKHTNGPAFGRSCCVRTSSSAAPCTTPKRRYAAGKCLLSGAFSFWPVLLHTNLQYVTCCAAPGVCIDDSSFVRGDTLSSVMFTLQPRALTNSKASALLPLSPFPAPGHLPSPQREQRLFQPNRALPRVPLQLQRLSLQGAVCSYQQLQHDRVMCCAKCIVTCAHKEHIQLAQQRVGGQRHGFERNHVCFTPLCAAAACVFLAVAAASCSSSRHHIRGHDVYALCPARLPGRGESC